MPLPVCSFNTYKKNHSRVSFLDYQEERDKVIQIIKDVRKKGDKALREYALKFDQARIDEIKVSDSELAEAASSLQPEMRDALQGAKENIEKFHRCQVQADWWQTSDGKISGQRCIPIDSVGVYIPGGTAAYLSSVLMTVIPAKIAGVNNIYITTPTDDNCKINQLTLAAAYEAGATAVFRAGGAQAIAALAYGTETVPAVDKIVGPGNIYVTLAKKEVFGHVGIDMLAGPSEIVIVAEKGARPDYIAADMLSQAEHDQLSRSILVTTSEELAGQVLQQLEEQLESLPRKSIAEKSLQEQGAIIMVPDLDQAWPVVNKIAPEHLELHLPNAWSYLEKIKNAASIFLGPYTPESLGDYWAGSNHVLPTSTAARFASALGVADFLKRGQVLAYTKEELEKAAPKIALLARTEDLEAHARSVLLRGKNNEPQD